MARALRPIALFPIKINPRTHMEKAPAKKAENHPDILKKILKTPQRHIS